MNELRIERNWIQVENQKRTQIIFTIAGVLVYLFLTFILGWSWLNYFSVSLQIGIQLFFILSSLKEKLIIQPKFIEYKFGFIRKKVEFDFFVVQNSQTENYNSLSKTEFYKRIVFYKDNKPKFSLDDKNWDFFYEEILQFLNLNSEEYELEKIHEEDISNHYVITILSIIFLIFFVFGIGLLIENPKNIKIDKLKTINGHIQYQPEILKHVEKGGVYYTMPFLLTEFSGYKFILSERGINKINGKDFIKTNKVGAEIKFMISQNEYDISIAKTQELAYFTSHIYIQNKIRIYGIYFQNQHLFNENSFKTHFKENIFEIALFIITCCFIFLGFAIYGFYKIHSA